MVTAMTQRDDPAKADDLKIRRIEKDSATVRTDRGGPRGFWLTGVESLANDNRRDRPLYRPAGKGDVTGRNGARGRA
jgi:hypothetical protein